MAAPHLTDTLTHCPLSSSLDWVLAADQLAVVRTQESPASTQPLTASWSSTGGYSPDPLSQVLLIGLDMSYKLLSSQHLVTTTRLVRWIYPCQYLLDIFIWELKNLQLTHHTQHVKNLLARCNIFSSQTTSWEIFNEAYHQYYMNLK